MPTHKAFSSVAERNRFTILEFFFKVPRSYRFYCGVTVHGTVEIAFHFKFDTSWEKWKNRQATFLLSPSGAKDIFR